MGDPIILPFSVQKKGFEYRNKLPQADDVQKIIYDANLDDMGYDAGWGNHSIRVSNQDLKKNKEVFSTLLKMAFEAL